MKKLLTIFFIIASIFSSNAFAKTQGNYVGVDLLSTNQKLPNSAGRYNGRDVGIGFNYKYAVNFNNYFVAPGVFYNHNNSRVSNNDSGFFKSSDEIQNSYGAKLDFGYDVTDKFAVFATLGYIEYRYDSSLVSTSVDSFAGVNPESVSTEERTLYGFGIKYSLNESYDLSLAYEYFDNNKSDNFSLERVKANNVAKKYTDVIKIGASYRF